MTTWQTHRFQYLFVLCLFSFACRAQIEQQLLRDEWKEHPLVLNELNLSRLQQEGLLDSCQAKALLDLMLGAHFKSYFQLQGLACFDAQTYEQLLLYTFLPSAAGAFQLDQFYQAQAFQGNFIFRVSFPGLVWQGPILDNSSSQNYLGNDFSIQQKLKLQLSNQVQFILNSAKDRGEALAWSAKQKGPDFIACGLFYQGKTPVAKMAVGSFQFQWGQGLQLWTSRSMGRSIDLLQSVRVAQGLKSYNGTDEQRFLNGFGLQFNREKLEYYGLFSIKNIDVPSKMDTLELASFVSASSGYHRSALELQRQKQIQERIAGLSWQLNRDHIKMGSMLLFQQYAANHFTDSLGLAFLKHSPPFLLSLGFHLKGNFKSSYYYLEAVQLYQEKLIVFNSNAIVCGALFHLHTKIQFAFQVRYYGPSYAAFYEQGFHASQQANNEKGTFCNLTYQLQRKIKWQAYLDQYALQKLSINAFPLQRTQFRSVVIFAPKKTVQLQFSYQKQILFPVSSFKMEALAEIKREFTLNTGLQVGYQRFTQLSSSAYLTIQYHKLGFPLRLNAHFGAFFIPEESPPHYQLNYNIGFGSSTIQLSGQGYFFQMATAYTFLQNMALGFRCLWMDKNALFQANSQGYSYQNAIQNLQFDLQLKINF